LTTRRPPRSTPFPYTTLFRSIERPDLRIGEAAAGLDAAGEKHELRLRIIAAVGGEQRIPDILGVGQHDGDEIGRFVLALRERLRSEEHTSELHHVKISYAVFC